MALVRIPLQNALEGLGRMELYTQEQLNQLGKGMFGMPAEAGDGGIIGEGLGDLSDSTGIWLREVAEAAAEGITTIRCGFLEDPRPITDAVLKIRAMVTRPPGGDLKARFYSRDPNNYATLYEWVFTAPAPDAIFETSFVLDDAQLGFLLDGFEVSQIIVSRHMATGFHGENNIRALGAYELYLYEAYIEGEVAPEVLALGPLQGALGEVRRAFTSI